LFAVHYLNTVSNEAEDSSKPEEKSKSSKKVLTELDPFRGRGWRGQCVEAILLVALGSRIFGEAAIEVGVESFAKFVEADTVDVKLELLFERLKIFACKKNESGSLKFGSDNKSHCAFFDIFTLIVSLSPINLSVMLFMDNTFKVNFIQIFVLS
jgi:hypothetical protein